MGTKRELIYTGVVIVTAGVLPLILRSDYYLSVLVVIGLNTILVLGLNLLMGYAGQISLGHAAFFGLGAYASGILTATYGINPVLAALLGLIIVGCVALLVGIPSLKLRGQYLAMATLGFGIIVYILLKEMGWLTGGPSGLRDIPNVSLFGFTFDSDFKKYYLVWTAAILVLIISNNIVHSRVGRALRAIHTSEVAASVLGVDIQGYKLSVFVISALFASIAGSLFAHVMNFISPSSFGFHFSIVLVTMVVVGGMASIWGSIFGSSVLTLLPITLTIFQELDIVIYGVILMAIMILMPEGLTRGVVDRLKVRLSR
jgi:branched-chain amino acid transport system permease protein